MSTSTKTHCTIEIESAAAPGGPDVRQCDQEAVWMIYSSVGGGYGPPALRCWEHAGSTLDFLITEPTTERVLMERV
jgi:hypothetical protein